MADNISNFRQLFLDGTPLMDVRAPIEFVKGSFPSAVNHPLMNDSERQQVGTCYKQHGQQAAIDLGHKLVSGTTKAHRIQAWRDFAKRNPDGVLYCFRGGLRSQISQEWLLAEAGIDYPRVVGGYKAMRQFLLDTLQSALLHHSFVVVGGLTGSGKTEVLAHLTNSVDLEAHANHRGSSFGKRTDQQPSQIDFENRLAIDILKKQAKGISEFVLEDEGRYIGRCNLPLEMHQRMQDYPVVWLEDSLDQRMLRILKTYVTEQSEQYVQLLGQEAGFQQFAEGLTTSLLNIRKRLGVERYQSLLHSMTLALDVQQRCGAVDLHLHWIEPLLNDYFDPMYQHQREQKAARILFTGTSSEVIEFLNSKHLAKHL